MADPLPLIEAAAERLAKARGVRTH